MMHLHVLRDQCHHNLSLRASETTVGEHPGLPTSPTAFSLHIDYWDKQQEGEVCLVWTRKRTRCLSIEEKGMVRMSSKKQWDWLTLHTGPERLCTLPFQGTQGPLWLSGQRKKKKKNSSQQYQIKTAKNENSVGKPVVNSAARGSS